jgi:hypothetical protein
LSALNDKGWKYWFIWKALFSFFYLIELCQLDKLFRIQWLHGWMVARIDLKQQSSLTVRRELLLDTVMKSSRNLNRNTPFMTEIRTRHLNSTKQWCKRRAFGIRELFLMLFLSSVYTEGEWEIKWRWVHILSTGAAVRGSCSSCLCEYSLSGSNYDGDLITQSVFAVTYCRPTQIHLLKHFNNLIGVPAHCWRVF